MHNRAFATQIEEHGMARTLEQRLKFDLGLPIGVSCVRLVKGHRTRLALIEISNRGVVQILPQPEAGDMYTSWAKVQDDALAWETGKTIVWAARSEEFRKQYAAAFSTIAADLIL